MCSININNEGPMQVIINFWKRRNDYEKINIINFLQLLFICAHIYVGCIEIKWLLKKEAHEKLSIY